MTNNSMATATEEEEENCESSRGKESKFAAERSGEAGTNAENVGSNSGDSGNGNADSASGKNNAAEFSDRESRGRYRIPSNFCRDFIFHTCKRRDCKYEHPDPNSKEFKEARASRPELGSRSSAGNHDRSRSPHQHQQHESHSSGGGGKPIVCRDFLRNMCYRGNDCRFFHPQDSSEKEELPWPQLCIDYRFGSCKRADCRFLHYSSDDKHHYMITGSVRKELWQNFINLTLRDPKLLKNRPVCKQYLRSGDCSMDGCRFRHISRHEYDDEMYHVITQMVYETCRRESREPPPPPSNMPPPRDPGDMPPPNISGPNSRGPPMGPPPFGSSEGDMRGGRRDYDWQHCSPYGSYGNKPDSGMGGPGMGPPPVGGSGPLGGHMGGGGDVDQLSRENMDLRRMMSEDGTRYKLDLERLNMENSKLQEQLAYYKASGGSSVQQQQFASLQQENAEYAAKVKTMNDMSVELQAKYSTTRRECEELRDSVKVLNLELATINDEKVKLKRKTDELEAKLQVALANKEEANLAVEKKEYLENKLKQFYEGMKRCESDIAATLEKNFSLNTPNIMSYFPTWGYLMSFITEIVTQINSSSGTTGTAAGAQSYVGYGSTSHGNYSVPPPSVTAPLTAAAPVAATVPSVYSYSDYSYSSAPSQAYGSSSMPSATGSSGYYGSSYPSGSTGYGSTQSSSGSHDDGRSSSKSMSKKDSYMSSSPWKKRS